MSLFGTGRREGCLAVLLLAAVALCQHAQGLLLGSPRRVVPAEAVGAGAAAEGDRSPGAARIEGMTNQGVLFPALRQAGARVRDGELPLWNSNNRFGEPFSCSGAPIWYPPYWLLMIGLPPWRVDLLLCLHSILACVFMYRFLRCLPLSRYVAFLGGAMYGLGWFMTVSLDRLPEAAAAAWLPFALEMTRHCLFSRRRLAAAALLGVGVCAMFLTGGSTTAWLGIGLCVAFLAAGLQAIDSSERGSALGSVAVGALTALLLCAPVWLEHVQLSGSLHQAEDGTAHRLQTAGIAGLVAPGLFAGMDDRAPMVLRDANPGADPMELALYPGALWIFLAALGLFRPKRTFTGVFWLMVAASGLILALDGPLADWLTRVTGWSTDRPGASLVLFHFALVVLGGIALENFFDAPHARRFAVPLASAINLAGCACVLLFGLVFTGPAERVITLLSDNPFPNEVREGLDHALRCLVIPAAAIASTCVLFLIWRPLGILRFKTALAVIVMAELCMNAFWSVPRAAPHEDGRDYAALLPADCGRILTAGRADLPPANWLGAEGLAPVNTDGAQIVDRTARYLALIDPKMVSTRHRSYLEPLSTPDLVVHPLASTAAVAAGVSAEAFEVQDFVPLAPAPLAAGAGAGFGAGAGTAAVVHVALRDPAPQRAQVFFQARVARDLDHAVDSLRRAQSDLDEVLVIEDQPADFECKRPAEPARIEWLEERSTRVRLGVEMADGRGYLMLADAFAPGWQATVDGQPTAIVPADVAFRALPLREGSHVVEFVYRPWSFRFGAPLWVLGMLLAAAAGAAGAWRGRPRRRPGRTR